MSKQSFPLSPDAFGNKWLGKVTRFEEMTAGDFDALRGASLSEKIGADAPIMYLETVDVQNPDQGRATFFTLDTRPVSKWARFITSLRECGIILKSYDDLVGRILYFEEREEEMGKRGKQRIWEVVGIPSPDEIAIAGEKVKSSPSTEIRSDDYIKELILGVADGLTRSELIAELKGMGVDEPEERIKNLSNQLVAQGKLAFRNGKFSVK